MTRARSPNYPALSLPQAIDRIRQVYQKQHLTPETREVVVEHMGYNSLNGRSAKSLSALIKFGLLESDGEGYKVSDRALDILEPESSEMKDNALFEAANSPKLFADLFERYEQLPTRASLSAYLVRSGFTQKAVDAVAKSFEETFVLISGLSEDNESSTVKSESFAPDIMETFGFGFPGKDKSEPKPLERTPAFASAPEIEKNCTRPVFDFDTVQIVTRIDNQADLGELMKRLEAIRSLLPEKASTNTEL